MKILITRFTFVAETDLDTIIVLGLCLLIGEEDSVDLGIGPDSGERPEVVAAISTNLD